MLTLGSRFNDFQTVPAKGDPEGERVVPTKIFPHEGLPVEFFRRRLSGGFPGGFPGGVLPPSAGVKTWNLFRWKMTRKASARRCPHASAARRRPLAPSRALLTEATRARSCS